MAPYCNMFRMLREQLNPHGYLEFQTLDMMSPRKVVLHCATLRVGLQNFCKEAVETIAANILVSCTNESSPYFGVPLDEAFDLLEHLGAQSNILAALALALLVHASKVKNKWQVTFYIRLIESATSPTYRVARDLSSVLRKRCHCPILFADTLASWVGSEVPSATFLREARRLLRDSILTKSLLQGLDVLNAADIDAIDFYFVFLRNKGILAWSVPGGIAFNVYTLRSSATLRHPVAFVVLAGHEIRHALERKAAGDDHNFSTPTKTTQDPQSPSDHRESGLGFELTAIGGKYDFSFNNENTRRRVYNLISAIEDGIGKRRMPALTTEDKAMFADLEKQYNEEMAFDCATQYAGVVFTD